MKRRDLLKVLPVSVGFGFVLGWLTPKPRVWMFYVNGYVMNLSWHLRHLSEKDSQWWLLLFALIPLVLLVVLIVSVMGFIRLAQLGVRAVRHLRRPSDSGLRVSHFPSMITFVVALIAFAWGYGHSYRTMHPYFNIPAGEIIRESDLSYVDNIGGDKLDLATDPRAVIGHKALKLLPAGQTVHLSDVSK